MDERGESEDKMRKMGRAERGKREGTKEKKRKNEGGKK